MYDNGHNNGCQQSTDYHILPSNIHAQQRAKLTNTVKFEMQAPQL